MINRTLTVRVLADVLLALPFAAILAVVLTAAARTPIMVGVAVVVALAAQVGLHWAAVRAAKRLGSGTLPWSLWATSAVCLWILVAGILSVTTHISNVQSGIDDSALIGPAFIVGAVGVASSIAAVVISGRIGILMLRKRATSPRPLAS